MAYTTTQLQEAFDKVKDKTDWKNEIKAVIEKTEDMVLIQEAIAYYTSTLADFTKLKKGPNAGKILVTAAGYRMGPAGDH